MGAIDALLLQARLLWDGDAADRGMASASQQADKLERKFLKAFKTIGTAMAAAFTVDKIVGFGKECVQAGAEVNAEMSAFGQIMGDYADEASTKVQGIADATGMVSTRLTPYMTSMTAKFKGLGYDVEDATDMAAKGLNLAADGAAFWDMSMDESTAHLNSFINGSYEGGEAIGLFANDTQMAAFAVQQGLVKSTKEWANLDEATKQATRLEYAENMYEQSGATGQAAKESNQYANVMANLSEKWRQFQAQIGTPLIQNVVIPAVNLLSKGIDALSVAIEYVKELFEGLWVELGSRLQPVIQSVSDFLTGTLVPALMGLWSAIQDWVQPILQAITDFIQNTVVPVFRKIIEVTAEVLAQAAPILEAIKTAVSTAFEACKIVVETVWGVIKTVVSTALQVIKGIIDTVTALIKGDWSGAWEAIKGVAMTIWEGIKTVISTVFSGIWSFIVTTLSGIMGYWSSVWEAIKGVAVAIWDNIKGTVTGVFNAVKGFITTTLTGIKTFWTTAWNGIKTTASTIWNGIKTAISTAINAVKTTITSILGGIKTFWSTAWNGIQTTAFTVWNGIKTTVSTAFGVIKTTISSAVDRIKSWLSFSGLVDRVKGIFEDVKNGIKGEIEDARDLVKGIVDKIVGFFTGAKFTWPKIPMPHFGISPRGWSVGDLLRGSIPKLSIDWYAKAMDNAMVLDGASIFGAADGNLLGGGEAGREVVSGEAHLIDLIGRAVAQNNAAMLDVLRRILGAILDMDESMYNTIVDALTDGVKFDIDGRQFGRLVRTYA